MSTNKQLDEIPGLPLPEKVCPYCGCQRFYVTAHVTQDWIVDGNGTFEKCTTDCGEITHKPDDEDLWQCVDCGYDAAGAEFNNTDFSQPSCRYVMRVYQRDASFLLEEFKATAPEKLAVQIERQWQSDDPAVIAGFWKKHHEAYEGCYYSVLDLENHTAIIHGIWSGGDLAILCENLGDQPDDADEGPRFTLFEEIVEALDDLKQSYYLLQYCRDHLNDLNLNVVAAQQFHIFQQRFLTEQADSIVDALLSGIAHEDTVLLKMLKTDVIDNLKSCQVQDLFGALVSVRSLYERILDEHRACDDTFYRAYGEFWNEVPLPDCVERVFTAYVESRKASVPGMLGVEGPRDEMLPEGTTGISYYDLSDLAILFENRTAAEAFAEENGVEPSQFLTLYGCGFQAD